MNHFKDVSPKTDEGYVQGVVEISRGSNAKCEYNEEKGYLELDRGLITAMSYPFNYGFIPQTLGRDGDPLDVIFFTDIPLPPLCVVPGNIIGVLEMIDGGDRDDKIVILPKFNHRYNEITEVQQEYLQVYVDFFENTKRLQKKSCEILGWKGSEVAYETFKQARARHKS